MSMKAISIAFRPGKWYLYAFDDVESTGEIAEGSCIKFPQSSDQYRTSYSYARVGAITPIKKREAAVITKRIVVHDGTVTTIESYKATPEPDPEPKTTARPRRSIYYEGLDYLFLTSQGAPRIPG